MKERKSWQSSCSEAPQNAKRFKIYMRCLHFDLTDVACLENLSIYYLHTSCMAICSITGSASGSNCRRKCNLVAWPVIRHKTNILQIKSKYQESFISGKFHTCCPRIILQNPRGISLKLSEFAKCIVKPIYNFLQGNRGENYTSHNVFSIGGLKIELHVFWVYLRFTAPTTVNVHKLGKVSWPKLIRIDQFQDFTEQQLKLTYIVLPLLSW